MKLSRLWGAATVLLGTTVVIPSCQEPPTEAVGVHQAAVHHLGTFEVEGDAVDDSAVPGEDWNAVTSAVASTGVLADAPGTSIFTGGRKDIQDIPSWAHKSGSVPDKDDITNAYAAAYNVAGDLVIYFGADRYANDGDAMLGFWFFQNDVQALGDGGFSGEHEEGDMLILVNFEQGGKVGNVQVLQWVGSGGDQKQGTLDMVLDTADAECGATADDVMCAITNKSETSAPWAYAPKGGMLGDAFPPESFFEGGINMTKVFTDGNLPCFASFMAETRSSTSVTATLKDSWSAPSRSAASRSPRRAPTVTSTWTRTLSSTRTPGWSPTPASAHCTT